jgi:hypothetical protein
MRELFDRLDALDRSIADLRFDAFERGIEGRDMDAVVAAVVDQVIAGRAA